MATWRANAMAIAPPPPPPAYVSRGADYAKHVETLRGCADPTQGRAAEAGIAADGLHRDTFLGNLLVQMYGRCRLLDEAFVAFDRIATKNAFSYTLLMSACVHNGHHRRAVDVYKQMRRQRLRKGPVDQVTLLIALSACSRLGDLAQGLEVHDDAGASPSPAVQNAVMSMYERCGSLERAWVVFRSMQEKSVVSWNTMIAANARNGQGREALRLLSEMDLEGQRADQYTFVSILGACNLPAMLAVGLRLHSRISCQGYERNVFVATALVTMYSRAGRIELARSVFEGLAASGTGAGVVSWNAMLAAEAQAGENSQVLELYDRMQLAAVDPDTFTLTIVLTACAASASGSERGLELAAAVERRPAAMADEVVQNALVNLYARCGKLREARAVALTSRSVAAWNSVIAAYDRCGRGDVAIELYDAMAARGVAADEYTFAAVVGACTSTGELDRGRAVHVAITAAGMDGDDVVKRGLVNMYAKCGSLDDARRVFAALDDVVSWTAMIVGYSHHGRGQEAAAMFKAMILEGLQPDCITLTAVLHACSHDGVAEEARSYVRFMGDDYGIELTLEHYHCVIDLLARLGRLAEALELIENMPFDSRCDLVAWMSLLSACKTHKNLKHASAVVRRIQELGRRGAAPYVIVSSIVTPHIDT